MINIDNTKALKITIPIIILLVIIVGVLGYLVLKNNDSAEFECPDNADVLNRPQVRFQGWENINEQNFPKTDNLPISEGANTPPNRPLNNDKCGDGVCDEHEQKNPDVCPMDC